MQPVETSPQVKSPPWARTGGIPTKRRYHFVNGIARLQSDQ